MLHTTELIEKKHW